jgi:hypothetical protein
MYAFRRCVALIAPSNDDQRVAWDLIVAGGGLRAFKKYAVRRDVVSDTGHVAKAGDNSLQQCCGASCTASLFRRCCATGSLQVSRPGGLEAHV